MVNKSYGGRIGDGEDGKMADEQTNKREKPMKRQIHRKRDREQSKEKHTCTLTHTHAHTHTRCTKSLCRHWVQGTATLSFQSVSPSSWSVRTKQVPTEREGGEGGRRGRKEREGEEGGRRMREEREGG